MALSLNLNEYLYCGNDKFEANDYTGAISDYSKAIELDPNDFDAYYNRALSKTYLKGYSEAITD